MPQTFRVVHIIDTVDLNYIEQDMISVSDSVLNPHNNDKLNCSLQYLYIVNIETDRRHAVHHGTTFIYMLQVHRKSQPEWNNSRA